MNKPVRKKLTTHQIAQMLGVTGQSVSNWIDAGRLLAERTPGGHRRVEREDLRRFLKERDMRIPPELGDNQPVVLVVDDEVEVAQWIAKTLREQCKECVILTAHDGFDAGKLVTAERPDVVILDLYMPGMNGFEVCRRIKADPQTASTKVIAITAHPSEQTEQAITEAGAEAYFPKPLDARQLTELLGGWLPISSS